MTAAIVPFRRTGSGGGPRARARPGGGGHLLPAADQSETLRQTRKLIDESWSMRAESAAIKRRYLERQARLEVLLQRIDADVKGEGG